MSGSLNVLNVGAGDIEITFDRHDSEDRDRALRMLHDMQRRGYAILVKLDDGTYVRAERIDLNRGRYVVQMPEDATLEGSEPEAPPKKQRGRPRGKQRRSVDVTAAQATGVARSAGG